MIDLFFPSGCQVCGQRLLASEDCICIWCLHQLPLACPHRSNDPQMLDRFYGRLRLNAATALLEFQKEGATQKLLHRLKYRGQQRIGKYLGNWLGEELLLTTYRHTEVVVPVPLHKRKRRKRGYNQVASFAMALAKKLNAEYMDQVLRRTQYSSSSVFKGRKARSMVANPFKIERPELIRNKAVLLVDDVITTGITLEHCGGLIWEGNPAELRLATMFIA